MVLAKLGGAVVPVIAAISALCSVMPRSNAGGKCSGRMRSNGGRPNDVVQASKNGLSVMRHSRSALPCLPPLRGAAEGAGFVYCPGCSLLGFVLVEHGLSGGIALGAEFGAVVAAPLVGGGARRVGPAEMRHHIAGVKLVGSLGRLEIGPVVGLVQESAKRPLLLVEPFDQRDRVVGRATNTVTVLGKPFERVLARRHDEARLIVVEIAEI